MLGITQRAAGWGFVEEWLLVHVFCLETPDCQVTFPINVIKRDVISSQRAASLRAQAAGALRGGREEVRYNTARQNAI